MKQVIVWRNDLKVRKGKLIAQCCHASMKAVIDSTFRITSEFPELKEYNGFLYEQNSYIDIWLNNLFTKVVCRVDNEEELLALYQRVREYNGYIQDHQNRIPVALITDSGKTEFHGVPTNTCIAIGPGPISTVDLFTSTLKLL